VAGEIQSNDQSHSPLPQTGGVGALGASPAPTPDDQRSNAMNPNHQAHKATGDNRSNQLNPNNPAYKSSRGFGGR